jgi:hypothetical protein
VSIIVVGLVIKTNPSLATTDVLYVGSAYTSSESARLPLQVYGETKNWEERFSLSYMTAGEMQQKIVAITGFLHRDFDTYADVLGRWDPRSGTRTADRPSLVSFLFIKKISRSVADAVIEREVFLDPDERVVFRNTDFSRSPTDSEIESAISVIYQNWLQLPIDADILDSLSQDFRSKEHQAGFIEAYTTLIEVLLQHGAIYYY